MHQQVEVEKGSEGKRGEEREGEGYIGGFEGSKGKGEIL